MASVVQSAHRQAPLTPCAAPPRRPRAAPAAQTGGEDDLVSVWSFAELRLVARAAGHSSWVTSVHFDPYAPGQGAGALRVGIAPAQSARENGGAGAAAGARANGRAGGAVSERLLRERASPPALAVMVAVPPVRKLAFGSVGMDARLLLWELEVEEPTPRPDAASPQTLSAHAGAQVHVSHARGARASERGAALNGRVAHEPHFAMRALTPTAASPSARAANGRAAAVEPQGARAPPGQLVVAAVPLSATAVLKPLGGVAAHAEPVTGLAFTQSAILTAGLDGSVRVWIPRAPPGTAPPAGSGAPALTYNLVAVQTTSQQKIYTTSKPCYIDPALTSSSSPRQVAGRLSY